MSATISMTAGRFSIEEMTELPAVGGKATQDCFSGSSFACRDEEHLNSWLPALQLGAGPCVVATLAFEEEWTHYMAAAAVLGMRSSALLGEALIANNHILTAPQFEKMAKIMRGERYGIFCFTRSSDANDPVVVLSSNPYGLQLATGIDRLSARNRWRPEEYRLLVPNVER